MDILLAIIIIVLVVVIPSIKIVPQAKSYVIERFIVIFLQKKFVLYKFKFVMYVDFTLHF